MGDILMLKGTPSPWSSGVLENPDIDALPYIDHDYADPMVKAEVDKLIEEAPQFQAPRRFPRSTAPCPQVRFRRMPPVAFRFFAHFF